jgi:ATP phosphoribosyltransferase regulatory subunit
VARDIIARPLAESLDYARKTDFRMLLAVGGEQDEVTVIRVQDGQERKVAYRQLLSESFKL